jgi:hypothetical protein
VDPIILKMPDQFSPPTLLDSKAVGGTADSRMAPYVHGTLPADIAAKGIRIKLDTLRSVLRNQDRFFASSRLPNDSA